MLKDTENFVPSNRESIDYHDNKLKQIEKSLKLTETGMGTYQIAPILSLTALPESPRHYGRPSEAKKPSLQMPQTKYGDTFVKATVPLEDESENRAHLKIMVLV